MEEFEIWVYRGLLGLLFLVLWWIIKRAVASVNDKFDNISFKFEQVGEKLVGVGTQMGKINSSVVDVVSQLMIRDERISNILSVQEGHSEKLRDHSLRIRNIEFTVCNYEDCPAKNKTGTTVIRKRKTTRKPQDGKSDTRR
jgi:hypothetical protein